MEFCQDAQFKLEAIPSSTVEYVESLTFLDDIQEKVSNKEDLIFIVNMSFYQRKYFTAFQQLTIRWPRKRQEPLSSSCPPKRGKENGKGKDNAVFVCGLCSDQ